MSGIQITASTLVNKIVYRTDLNSLKKVRNDMRKLQKDFSKTEGTIAKAKMQAQNRRTLHKCSSRGRFNNNRNKQLNKRQQTLKQRLTNRRNWQQHNQERLKSRCSNSRNKPQ